MKFTRIRNWIGEWYEIGWDASWNDERIPLRSYVAYALVMWFHVDPWKHLPYGLR